MSRHIVEEFTPFSKSLLWKLQIKAYQEFALKAWTEKGVPFYLTSSPLLAKSFAWLSAAYIEDLLMQNERIEITFFDLGAGTGRFAYLFLKFFQELSAPLKERLSFKYVMTDISEENLLFLENHFRLRPFFDAGIADTALFFHNQKEPIKLRKSHQTLDQLNNAILIANYFFDTIPQELYRVTGGIKEKGLVKLTLPENKKGDFISDWISDLEMESKFEECLEEESKASELLDFYSNHLDNVPFLVPLGAFEVLEGFQNISKKPLLFLACDQGAATLDQMRHEKWIRLDKHGTFSIPVSYHALNLYLKNRGGFGLLPKLPDPKFLTMTGLVNGEEKDFPHLIQAYNETIADFEPKDYWLLIGEMEKFEITSLKLLLLLLKLGGFDPAVFFTFFPLIRKALELDKGNRSELLNALEELSKNFYPVSKSERDLWQNLGVIAFEAAFFNHAINYFEEAIRWGGETKELLQNLSAAFFKLGDMEKAKACQQKAKLLRVDEC